jgi:hypothetical protein
MSNRIPAKYSLERIMVNSKKQLDEVKYPVIFKPVKCTGSGFGVKKIETYDDAISYFDNNKKPFILEELSKHNREIGLLIRRYPLVDGKTSMKIVSIVEKLNVSNVKCGNGCKCGCVNRPKWITSKLEKTINGIIDEMDDNIYYGRFDIKFTNEEDLMNGENFDIIEFNGNMSYDLRGFLVKSLKEKMYVLSFIVKNTLTGIFNILNGNGKNILDYIYDTYYRVKIYMNGCGNWEVLMDEWG